MLQKWEAKRKEKKNLVVWDIKIKIYSYISKRRSVRVCSAQILDDGLLEGRHPM
jgi:hypothetical protein